MKRIVALALFVLCAAVPASAEDWPAKTVRVIVPFGAGATPDTIARLIADKLQQKLGQNFIVENKPGASGMTGTDTVAKARSEEHTSELQSQSNIVCRLLLEKKKTSCSREPILRCALLAGTLST